MAHPRIYGLIGYPIKHSLSPQMHNTAFKSLKINAEYRLFEVKPQELEDFLNNLDKNGIYGLNVTIPYKEKVLDFVILEPESFYLKQIKAVNTIVKEDKAWKGLNTDIPGFSKHLKENFNPEGKRAAILGAGGASRAVCYVLAESKAKEIVIFDIDKDKTKAVVEMIEDLFPGFNILAAPNIEDLDIINKELLVNATPIGLKESDPCLVKEEMLHKNLFVYDLIYNPAETKLLRLARKKGAKVSNGLGMLLYQGALSFKHFTEKEPPIEIMRQALKTRSG